ncbi:MAG: DrmB family protein [Gemmatimonadota bacterium]|nr:DrmB family protein [Gemmatimonadota bacterium]
MNSLGTFVDIRLSHLLRDCSVGAIVRHDRELMVVQDTRHWDGPRTRPYDREISYVVLVKRSLGLGDLKLCRPPVKKRQGDRIRDWVPARRFPRWMRCTRCDLLHHEPWERRDGGGRESDVHEHSRGTATSTHVLRCGNIDGENRGRSPCPGLLEQVPWVLVHEDGYLADVPWHEIAHHNARHPRSGDCRPDRESVYLKVIRRQGRWHVRCLSCPADTRLPDRFPYGKHTPQQPWVRERPPEPPSQPGLLIRVNDVRVHFAECRTALVVPPESRIRRGSVDDRLYSSSADQDLIRTARSRYARRSRYRTLAAKYRSTPEEVAEAFRKIERGELGPELPPGDLEQLEYGALTQPIPDLRPDEDFVTEHHAEAWRHMGGTLTGPSAGFAVAVEKVVAVHRLKEIMVFTGFRRGGAGEAHGRPPTPPDIVGESDWLPALELWGEGLFFALKDELVARWEAQSSARARAAEAAKRAEAVHLPGRVGEAVSPRLLLCHTLAHLIIRRLEAEAGYPAASLKERIYCADRENGDEGMAGVLIYVAVADTHGSLGGLMDIAQPDRFLRLLTGAVDDATWCSFDPVCGEQEGHGPDLLNRAACHACALVPEPSCICGNRLLDRAFVTGDGKGLQSLWDLAAPRRDR